MRIGDWGLVIGDWELGTGNWGLPLAPGEGTRPSKGRDAPPHHPVQQVSGDGLDPDIGALRRGVDRWPKVARRRAQPVTPPDGGRVEHDVALRAGVDRRRIGAAVRFAGRFLRGAAGHDLESRDRRRVAVPFPPHQTRHGIAGPHARPFEQPVLRPHAGPVGPTGHRTRAVGSDEFVGVGAFVGQGFHGDEIPGAPRRTEDSGPFEDAVRVSGGVG